MPFQPLADAVLTLHALLVAFVLFGPVVVLAGNRAGWSWVNAWSFRIAHLAVMLTVLAQSWFGIPCPLTVLENWLRVRARAMPYDRSFIEYWLQRLLFYEAPGWVFTAVYTAFTMLVIAMWWKYPPGRRPPHP